MSKKPKKLPKKLPKFLYKYFWDVKANQLNPQKFDVYIINRLLNRGNLKAVKWVMVYFPTKLIKKTIKKSRDWDKKSIYFWINYYGIDKKEVKSFDEQFLGKYKKIWPY